MPDIAGQRYYVTERARGYSSGYSKIYDEVRFINAVLHLLGSGRGAIVLIPDDDIAYNKTWTVITAPSSGTMPSCVADHNDDTSCSWSLGAITDLFSVDLGAPLSGLLRFLTSADQNPTVVIYGSNDGTTWTKINSYALSAVKTETLDYISGYRYLKFSAGLAATGTLYVYSFEFYPDIALSTSRALFNLVKRLVVFVYGAYYQLLEVITGV